MKTWDEVIKEGLFMHIHMDRYAYFYGAKGQRLTDAEMNYLWNAEPDYFNKRYPTPEDKKRVFDFSRGKIGYDCSGFIGAITGCKTWSGSIWARCTEKSKNLFSGPAASILYNPGHVAIDIGYGYFLEMAVECSSCEMGRISENLHRFESTGKLIGYIDYEGATNR